ncbi:unnamed protein product, partial [Meganyctiphanes norvegica]
QSCFYHPLGDVTTQRDTMRIVLALLFVGVANSASILTSHGHVRHGPSSAPSAQYMSVKDLFGSQPGIQEVAVAPVVKSAATGPYLLNGPVIEYTIPFGVDIPGINFNDEWSSQPAAVPVETVPVQEVVSYSSAPSTVPAPVVETYAAHTVPIVPAPAVSHLDSLYMVDSNPFLSITNMLQTFYKQDDGILEAVAPTHVSYSAPAPPALTLAKEPATSPTVWWTPAAVVKKDPVPVKEPETAPTVWWTPAPVVKKALFRKNPVVDSSSVVKKEKPETAPTVWWTPAPVVKKAPVAAKKPETAPTVWWTPAAVVKKEESIPTEEEEEDEASSAEYKSSGRAEKAEEEDEEEESDEKRR